MLANLLKMNGIDLDVIQGQMLQFLDEIKFKITSIDEKQISIDDKLTALSEQVSDLERAINSLISKVE